MEEGNAGSKDGRQQVNHEIEEKRTSIIRVIEERDILLEDDTEVLDPGQVEGKMDEEKKEIKQMLHKFWNHVSKAHEEVACAAGELARLVLVLEPKDYFKVIQVGTRPLITMEILQVKQMVAEKKDMEEWARSCEEMRNTKIEDIIIEQNLPTPLQ